MLRLEDRQSSAGDIEVAQEAGVRLRLACRTTGIDLRTLQRWKAAQGLQTGDCGRRLEFVFFQPV